MAAATSGPASRGPLVELNDITRMFDSGGQPLFALRGVSLRIEEGEFVAIMGTSGSGKSTLMNLLGALDRPTSGQYRLDGESVAAMNDVALSALRNRKIGFVFQSFNLLPRMTAVENVELPLTYARVPARERRERALQALAQVGLADRVHHRPTQLSGGQQQRVAMARALVTRPRLLLADEPTGALDSETTAQILALLSELHRQGLTLIVVTHEPDVARVARRVVIVRDGQIVADGPPETLLGPAGAQA